MNNSPQGVSGNSIDSAGSSAQVSKPVRISAQELHKYVIGLTAVFAAFVITVPIAVIRVTQSKKLAPYNFHLKSLTLEYKPVKPEVAPSATMPVETLAPVVTKP
jgi:hypothetical protein